MIVELAFQMPTRRGLDISKSNETAELKRTALAGHWKSKAVSIALTVAFAVAGMPDTRAGVSSQVLKPIMTVLTGAGAARALAKAFDSKIQEDQRQTIASELAKQGIDPTDGAIYSVYLNLDYHAHAIYWARWFSKPDLFAVVQFEGAGTYLIPDIERKFHGEPIQWTVLQRHATRGGRVVIQILDDHSVSNEIWNSILQTKLTLRHGEISYSDSLKASWDGDATLTLLDKHLVITAPTHIAYAEFQAPSLHDTWHAEGAFRDDAGHEIGKLEFAQVWTANSGLSDEIRRAGSSKIFWGVFGVVLLFVFFKLLFSNWTPSKST